MLHAYSARSQQVLNHSRILTQLGETIVGPLLWDHGIVNLYLNCLVYLLAAFDVFSLAIDRWILRQTSVDNQLSLKNVYHKSATWLGEMITIINIDTLAKSYHYPRHTLIASVSILSKYWSHSSSINFCTKSMVSSNKRSSTCFLPLKVWKI